MKSRQRPSRLAAASFVLAGTACGALVLVACSGSEVRIEPTDASFVATLATGWHTYRLEVGGDSPGADVFGVGYLSL